MALFMYKVVEPHVRTVCVSLGVEVITRAGIDVNFLLLYLNI